MSNDQDQLENYYKRYVRPSDSPSDATSGASEAANTQSRRRFLRAAVITGASAVAVGASADVVAEASGLHTGVLGHFGIILGGSSTSGNCSICFEKKSDYSHTTQCSHNVGTEYALWLTAHNLGTGSYTMSISPAPTNTSSPLHLLNTISQSNNASLFVVDGGKGIDCPSCDTRGYVHTSCSSCGPSNPVRQSHTTGGLFTKNSVSNPYQIKKGTHDLQMLVFLKWDGTSLGNGYTFTGAVKDGSGNTVCQVTLTIKSN